MFLRNHYVKRSLHNGFAKPLRKPAFFFFSSSSSSSEATGMRQRSAAIVVARSAAAFGGGLRRQDVHPHDDKSAHLLVQFLLPRLYLVAAEEYVQSSENHPTGLGWHEPLIPIRWFGFFKKRCLCIPYYVWLDFQGSIARN